MQLSICFVARPSVKRFPQACLQSFSGVNHREREREELEEFLWHGDKLNYALTLILAHSHTLFFYLLFSFSLFYLYAKHFLPVLHSLAVKRCVINHLNGISFSHSLD
jgi:hypothetical protein